MPKKHGEQFGANWERERRLNRPNDLIRARHGGAADRPGALGRSGKACGARMLGVQSVQVTLRVNLLFSLTSRSFISISFIPHSSVLTPKGGRHQFNASRKPWGGVKREGYFVKTAQLDVRQRRCETVQSSGSSEETFAVLQLLLEKFRRKFRRKTASALR